jgi:transcriptional regulator with XRE-family HTH domain
MNMTVKLAKPEFVEKIKKKMKDDNLGVTELARKIGVSHPRMVEVVTHGKMPSFDTCVALAKWLKQSDVSVLREAGLLPPGPSDDINFEDWKHLLSQMTPDERDEMRQIGIMKIDRRTKDQSVKSLKPKKVG